jgi:ribosomal protein S18 acetylase RimI-like enzyme
LSPDNAIVGFAKVMMTKQPPLHPEVWVRVHPAYEGQGIDRALHAWCVGRAKAALDRCPPDAPVAYRSFMEDAHPQSRQLAEYFGMQPVRSTYLMQIDRPANLESPVMPEGFTIRPMRFPDELEAVVHTVIETLNSLWEWEHRPFEVVLDSYRQQTQAQDFDPSFWIVAQDKASGELAGMVLCEETTPFLYDPELGSIPQLGVRQKYRRRGLAKALLFTAFAEFWKRGKQRVALGVDPEGKTGALQLYQNAGMVKMRSATYYEKTLRSGMK